MHFFVSFSFSIMKITSDFNVFDLSFFALKEIAFQELLTLYGARVVLAG